MRAAIVILALTSWTYAQAQKPPAAPEVASVATWLGQTSTDVDKAVARIGPKFRQVIVVAAGAGCMNKFKAGVLAVKNTKRWVSCLGKVMAELTADRWSVKTAEDLGDQYKPFLKQFAKDVTFVRGAYSDGYIIVVLGPAKDGGEPPVVGFWIDRSQAG